MVATMDQDGAEGPDADRLADRAEEVRAWLVQVRGGAPFLSSTDATLLRRWLLGGIVVTRILGAIEAAARHRRSKRLRAPFTLRSVERFLERPVSVLSDVRPTPAEGAPPLPGPVQVLAATAQAQLAALPGHTEEAARARCVVVREFHAAAWELLGDVRATLIAAAEVELADLRELMGDEPWQAVVEEGARHAARGLFPGLSIEVACAALEGPDGVA